MLCLYDHSFFLSFQRQYAPVEVFKTEMKGWGLRATDDIPS